MASKKLGKRTIPLILAALCVLLCSVPALADEMSDEMIDMSRTGSVSIEIRAYATEDAVGGGSLNLYRVAEAVFLDTEGYSYDYTAAFAGCSEELLTSDALEKAETARTFSEWVSSSKVSPNVTAKVSAKGTAQFTDLALGLYLVTQDTPADGYNGISAFLVSVPLYGDGAWIYDVDATPKTSPVTIAETETTKNTKVTQNPAISGNVESSQGNALARAVKTGDYSFLIYGVLVIAAALVIVFVILRRRAGRAAE